jgi:hypothetical protein
LREKSGYFHNPTYQIKGEKQKKGNGFLSGRKKGINLDLVVTSPLVRPFHPKQPKSKSKLRKKKKRRRWE